MFEMMFYALGDISRWRMHNLQRGGWNYDNSKYMLSRWEEYFADKTPLTHI